MTDAPETIWAWPIPVKIVCQGEWQEDEPSGEPGGAQYTRTDLAEAAERAAYLRGLEDALRVAEGFDRYDAAAEIKDAIRALVKEVGE